MKLQSAPKDTPYPLFEAWVSTAKKNDPEYYNGMCLATVNDKGTPSNRIVLLKEYDSDGFVFYTNYNSRKGLEISENKHVAATLWWSKTQQQIRIEGRVEMVPATQSDRYFLSRPQGSQLAAIASAQSEPVESFEKLDRQYTHVVEQYKNKTIQRPPHWGGYRIKPQHIEFWQGLTHRLHHRLVYQRSDEGWNTKLLQP